VQAELLASPAPGQPAITLTGASLSWEAGDLQKDVLHDISLQVAQIFFNEVVKLKKLQFSNLSDSSWLQLCHLNDATSFRASR
jgi:hypothetical protein